MLSDGSFEICGRCDSMVKIRGYSVETQVKSGKLNCDEIERLKVTTAHVNITYHSYFIYQAIEAALLDLTMVNACVVIVMGEEGEDKSLVAYVVPEGKTSKKDIRAALKRRLPFYMIPSYFVMLSW